LISSLIKYSHKVYEKEFVSATDGNLSIRLSDNKIAITRSGVNKGEVTEQDIIIVDLQGNKINGNGKASTETKIHLLAYNSRSDVNAVVHCHPSYATAFATAGLDFTKPVFPEVILGLGPVPLCKYATPSTDELPASMKPHINYALAMLLQNHGAITFGSNIEEAYNRMEKLEHAAKTLFLSKLLGGAIELNNQQVQKLYSIAEKTYGIKVKAKVEGKSNFTQQTELGYDSLTNSRISFTEIIEARLRARAGNPVFNKVQPTFNRENEKDILSNSNSIIEKILKDFNS
jgi:L-fuculose-phosphate aldolase